MSRWLCVLLVAVLAQLPVSADSTRQLSQSTDTAGETSGPDEDSWDEDWEDDWGGEWDDDASALFRGFVELALGGRLGSNTIPDRRGTLRELRLRLEAEQPIGSLSTSFKADLWRDEILAETDYKIRETSLSFSPHASTDVKIGRQVLTWGTGDLIFVNDLFPKDFSYFSGRDDEYLKAPSDALRLSFYSDLTNLDLVSIPRFAADEFFTGERFSIFDASQQGISAPEPPIRARRPSGSETALRLHRQLGSTEVALYAFDGYYKTPTRMLDSGELGFAPLRSWGASLRRPLGSGIGNLEFARYVSRLDRNGTDPVLPNDSWRLLLGYERELVTNLTAAFQYQLDLIDDHDALLANSPQPGFEPEEERHLLATRLTWRTRQDNLIWTLFTFYSPTDDDYHVRAQASYRYTDRWQGWLGLNLFGGQNDHTQLGQLEDNSNLFVRLRRNF